MSNYASLYDSARLIEVEHGGEQASVCVAELRGSPSASARRALLIHGNPSNLAHWKTLTPALRRHANVVAYDQPGLGRSPDFRSGTQSLERSAALAQAVLDHLGCAEPVDVVGQSHGGMVAVALAARAPHRVRSLTLLGTGGVPAHPMYRFFLTPRLDRVLLALGRALSPPQYQPFARASEGALRKLRQRALAIFVRMAARGSFAPDAVPAWVVEEGVHAPPAMLQTMVRLAQDRPCEKLLTYAPRVLCRVLFVHGRSDALVDISYARRLYNLMRDAGCRVRFEALPGGHMLHLTHPERVEPYLHAFLAEDD